MPSFREILTATDADMVKIFYKAGSNPSNDLIKQINKVAKTLDLNHAQLVCAAGFNRSISELIDIISIMGFRSYQLLIYRRNELYTTDAYQQLDIDNVLDIYAEHAAILENLNSLRELLRSRLGNIEAEIGKEAAPHHIMGYRIEIQAIYRCGIADKVFAEERLHQNIAQYRHMASEIKAMIDADMYPPSNMFFMDWLSSEEKRFLIKHQYVSLNMVKNRLQNSKLPKAEREMLEEFI